VPILLTSQPKIVNSQPGLVGKIILEDLPILNNPQEMFVYRNGGTLQSSFFTLISVTSLYLKQPLQFEDALKKNVVANKMKLFFN
jgi:hypothetical protein